MYTTRFAQSITYRTQVLQTLRLQRWEITLAPPLQSASRHLLCQPVGIFAALLTLHVLPTLQLNPLKPELNPICYLLALLAHHFLHVSRIRVKSLTIRLLMSYIYMEHLFLMFLDHTQRRSTVGRTPLDE